MPFVMPYAIQFAHFSRTLLTLGVKKFLADHLTGLHARCHDVDELLKLMTMVMKTVHLFF